VTFENVFVTDDKERPVVAGISLNPHALEAFASITGEIQVNNPDGALAEWAGPLDHVELELKPTVAPITLYEELQQRHEKAKADARRTAYSWPTVKFDDLGTTDQPVVTGLLDARMTLAHAEPSAVKSVETVFDGSPVYSASALPAEGEVMIETRRLPDGRHMLEARVALHDEQRGLLTGPITEKAAFVTRHFWDLYDDFTAPIGTGWFAGFEFSKTCAASAGWEYSSGREEEFLGDGSRRVRPSNSTEHLAWETPLLSEYKLALYAKEIAISSVIWVARIFVPPP
jgi:hypothetical protein